MDRGGRWIVLAVVVVVFPVVLLVSLRVVPQCGRRGGGKRVQDNQCLHEERGVHGVRRAIFAAVAVVFRDALHEHTCSLRKERQERDKRETRERQERDKRGTSRGTSKDISV